MLGLGNIGPMAALPVMEGKAALFKRFADIDAWPICIDTTDVDEIVRTVELIAPGFGGINLEDIAAPRCFEIEAKLRERLDIPVFHDDQHGTAIVVLAALKNALRCIDKKLPDVEDRRLRRRRGRLGDRPAAAGRRRGRRHRLGPPGPAQQGRRVADARRGASSPRRPTRAVSPAPCATASRAPTSSSASARRGILEPEWIDEMADQRIVFALANPDPEVDIYEATQRATVVAVGPQRLPEPDQQRPRVPRRLPRPARRARDRRDDRDAHQGGRRHRLRRHRRAAQPELHHPQRLPARHEQDGRQGDRRLRAQGPGEEHPDDRRELRSATHRMTRTTQPAQPGQRHPLDGRRAWAVWAAAISVYVLAVFHRTSLGVAGLEAADRFGISSSQLSTFTILQVFVYAAMQLPVGALLDRYGSKRMLGFGLTLLTVAQLGFAFVHSFEAALLCRVLLGMGDAMVFISVLRLVALWFSPRRTPMVTQLTGVLGQLGALAAAGPLAAALAHFGWTPSYAVAASVGVLSGVALVVVVKDSPYTDHHRDELRLRAIARTLRAAWLVPGTRLGLWSHFTSQFAANMFTMLWGFPFLVCGTRALAGDGQRHAHGHGRHVGRLQPGHRHADDALPVLPQHDGAVDRRRGDRGVDRRAALAGARPVVDARRPRGAHRRSAARAR